MKTIEIGRLFEIAGNTFIVKLNSEDLVECTFSTKAKLYYGRDLEVGENVQIEISPVDSLKGRIEPRGFVY